MRVLLIKMSSMGDVIHTLPALTDAGAHIKDITFDWVVEENFAEIPAWHPLVNKVLPIALRRWRKNIFATETRAQWKAFKNILQQTNYDLILDAQGLLKSACVASFAKGKRVGLNFHSAREPLASLFYQNKYPVEKKQHAINRTRRLFSQALGYAFLDSVPDYGVDRTKLTNGTSNEDYLLFLHGTTWSTKHWPETYWIELAKLAAENNYRIKLPWGNPEEKARAERIAANCVTAEVLPKLKIQEMVKVLAGAKAIVAVDTGLGHLAAALDVPTVSLYGPTDPVLTGTLGASQKHLVANFPCSPCLSRECIFKDRASYAVQPPCFSTLPPEKVWALLSEICQIK